MTISAMRTVDFHLPASGRWHTRFLQKLVVPAAALISFGFPGVVLAQTGERSWDLGIALGVGERSNPLVNGENIDINAVIDFTWSGKKFYFDNGDLGYTFIEQRDWSFSAIATFNNERNYYNYLTGEELGLQSIINLAPGSDKDGGKETFGKSILVSEEDKTANPTLPDFVSREFLNQNTELPDRDFALNGGFEFLYISPWGDIQAQVLSDVSSTHNGQEAWLSWSHPWYTANSEFNLTFGLEWKSANLVNYYYGVRPEEAFQGRAAYEAGSGTNSFIRLAARHSFSEHWNVVAMVEREFLSGAIHSSPIVADRAVNTFFTGLFYQF